VNEHEAAALEDAVRVLASGGVVAAATETLFALLADARVPSAVSHVFELKHRDLGKGVALLLPDRASWRDLVADIPDLASALADRFWPGPLTIALPAREGLDARLLVDGTVGVRWPAASKAARIATAFGAPLTATSCNLVGQPACVSSDEVRRSFASAIASGELHVVEGVAPGGAPSTILTVDGDAVRILRAGAIATPLLERVVEEHRVR
jgi:L-threonylcarbamoyladenylate synthase